MAIKTSDKLNAQYLAQLLKKHGCRTVVIAPGSRNAPMIISFSHDEDYRCLSVPDERVAAFTAMGLTLEKREPVAVICSSGSATVNFYPAVVEAYYQNLPLVVITADRPLELIDQGFGQTMRQPDIFEKHIACSVNLIREPSDNMARNYNQRCINEAMLATQKGPVHINVPFSEPLYGRSDTLSDVQFIDEVKGEKTLRTPKLQGLADVWNDSPRIWVLAGQLLPDSRLEKELTKLNELSPFLIFSESLSNLHCSCNIHSIDRLINTIDEKEKAALQPDLLISIGGEVVSKMVKQYLREYQPKAHWYINETLHFKDTYGSLSEHIQANPALFFAHLAEYAQPADSDYRDHFLALDQKRMHLHSQYLETAPWSDFSAFKILREQLPQQSILHCANSTAIRYSQLFDHDNELLHFANRGTSGIDGCTSTAVGHALNTDKIVTLVTGDVAFLYDSNAFWNAELPSNLRVVVLNNNGGNIFRIIAGPGDDPAAQLFQETPHHARLKGVAETWGVHYQCASNESELRKELDDFFRGEELKILEVQTPRQESPNVLKAYFRTLKEQS